MAPLGVPVGASDGQKTFLEICQRFVRETRISRSASLLPTTVLNQTGQMRMVVDWCADAWVDIQNLRPDWRFKRRTAQFVTVNGQQTYTPEQAGIDPETFGHWIPDSFRNWVTSVGEASEMFMRDLPYAQWRDGYQFGTTRTTTSRPTVITVLPNNSLGLGLPPTGDYTVFGDYYTAPIRMEADEDIPELPIQHSYMLIVYEAMLSYGYSEVASEVLARAEKKRRELMTALVNDQTEPLVLVGSR